MHIVFILATALLVSACNTMQGMGRDIEKAGEAISGSAATTKKKMQD